MKKLEEYLDKEKGIIDLTGVNVNSWNRGDLIQLIRDNQNVTILKLADTDISCEDLQLLIQSGVLNDITELDLSNNQLADGDMSVIPFNKQLLSKLTVLDLHNNCMENNDVKVIVKSNLAQQLTKLDLSGNEIKDAGAEYIAKADFENLTELNLASNSIGDEGSTAILTYGGLLNLEALDLSFNAITDQAMEDIKEYYNARYGLLDRLQELYIGANYITGEGVINLVNIDDCFENLHTLSFDNAGCENEFIGDKGVEAIVNSEGFSDLTHLLFAVQRITDMGAECIAESRNLGNLKVLDIQGNNIHDEGMEDIITSKNLPELEELCFAGNDISPIMVMKVKKWGVDKGIETSFDKNLDKLLEAIYKKTLPLIDIIFKLCEVKVKIKDECTEDKKVVEPGIKYAQHILDVPEQYSLDINDKDSQGRSFDDLDTQYSCLNMWLINRFPDHTFPYGDHTALDRQLSAELLGSTISDRAEH
ncbi:MAG: hypothetical protein PV347_00250 [Rickettsiaceae bacterium]|nr:hypothetical protein [Rickettsiaceae bacterium]MDD9337089.1 hypothetical protein [Rickettsiaceae bacterium]